MNDETRMNASRPSREAETTSRSLAEQVASLDWVHQIDLGGGVITPGRWPPHPLILRALDNIDFRGKKVLDIGCWDGLWSFEAERRGAAEVYATDYVSQRSYHGQPTFELAHRALNSRAKYHPKVSVYDIESLGIRDFDIVIFCGVYYHLRNPLRALALLRRVMNENAILVIEGDTILGTADVFARFYYKNWHAGDASNWWIPTAPCLREWIESCFFEIADEYLFETQDAKHSRLKAVCKRILGTHSETVSRIAITARAVCRRDPNYVFPDDEFASFDRNDYESGLDHKAFPTRWADHAPTET